MEIASALSHVNNFFNFLPIQYIFSTAQYWPAKTDPDALKLCLNINSMVKAKGGVLFFFFHARKTMIPVI